MAKIDVIQATCVKCGGMSTQVTRYKGGYWHFMCAEEDKDRDRSKWIIPAYERVSKIFTLKK